MKSHQLHLRSRLPRKIVRIARREGRFEVDGLNQWYHYLRDPYHLMLTVPWKGFILLVAIAYILLNTIFACLYLLGGDSLVGGRPGSFEDAFFFSVHTFASIGYGVIAPKTTYANLIVTLEAIMSLLSIAVVTGLAFARFTRPVARIMFSHRAIVAPHNGVPTLMMRAANQRRNQILEAEARLYFTRDEQTLEGQFIRRFYELPLSRHRTPSFSLTWTIMHPIDEASPLYGETPESLDQSHAQFILSLMGLDETVAYTLHARHLYSPQDLQWDHQFIDLIYKSPTGDRYLDYTHFHGTQPMGTKPM
ncbi:MAG: ion channel [Synechococcales bacterium]|nr:ion channel [Synechococcales bacterium]